ncbi:helix-turn-helix domain-containing protein [Demequina capsici]|uniref:Helix-turn-helix domain-containing protein n=1 Tax=Demequina capsici TaxID=3075620 RepID=A0AA96JGZ3_9MICO|nr:helix-turn-helix domain-containing protein [Demequina sp. PMTSA13]WNM28454.1 helix-turn-helix domain-containing protein [Demequina sp. PMTSA13]
MLDSTEDRWLPLKDACAYVSLSEKTLRKAINDPNEPVPLQALRINLNGAIRIKRKDLDEWLEARDAWVDAQTEGPRFTIY